MEIKVPSAERLAEFLTELPAAAVLFSGPGCAICHALKPKLETLLEEEFPRLSLLSVDIHQAPEAAAKYMVFTIPTLLLFFDGRESARFVRAFGMDEVRGALERPYGLLFGGE